MSQRPQQHQPLIDDASRSVFPIFEINDTYQKVVEYLNPKELHNFTLSYGTSLRDRPLLTYSVVMKNALLNGNKYTKIRIERIYAQVLANTILIPKPTRLLRLLAENHCECCSTRKVNLISDYGLVLCLACKKELTSRVDMKPAKLLKSMIEMNDIIQHPDVNLVLHHFMKEQPYTGSVSRRLAVYYALNESFFDENNDRVGPITTISQLNEMTNLPDYQSVEQYIEANKPNQSQARQEFIHAMSLHRERCHKLNEKKTKEQIMKVKKYRFNKYMNTKQAIALLLERIPDNLRHKLEYSVHFSFSCPPELTRHPQMVPLNPFEYLLLADTTEGHTDGVHAILTEGPPDGYVHVRIRHRLVERVIKPLLDCPTKYNDETKWRHRANLHHLAQVICKHYKSPGENEYPSTW